MVTQLEEVYRPFLNSIEDHDWLMVSDEIIEDLLLDLLEKATSDFYTCRKNLDIDYNSMRFYERLDRDEIVILSKAMIIHYLDPKILREQNLQQAIGVKDYTAISRAPMLEKLISLQEHARKEFERRMSNYDYKMFEGLN